MVPELFINACVRVGACACARACARMCACVRVTYAGACACARFIPPTSKRPCACVPIGKPSQASLTGDPSHGNNGRKPMGGARAGPGAGTLTTWPRVPARQAQEFGQGLTLRNLTIEERDRHRLGEGWRTSAALSTARMRDCADGVRSSQTATAGLKLT